MALLKKIENENGIILNYHRIVSINNVTNIISNIEVASYINQEQRLKEEKYQQIQLKNSNNEQLTDKEEEIINNGINVFTETKFYNVEYNKLLNVDNAYEYLKKLDTFKDAENI